MFNKLISRYKQFYSKYVVQKRRPEEYFINRYYAHLIDPFFTKLVYVLGLSPNAVTIITGAMGILAAVSFYYEHWIAGAILLQLHHFFDGADGNLARLTNRCTPLGAKLDKLCDQIVRLCLFVSLAIVVDVPTWASWALIITIYLDAWIIHQFVLPFARKNSLIRSKWKLWFLKKGIIPGFDIFTIYFIISLSALCGCLDYAIYTIIVMKNVDWIYRVWECIKTKYILGRSDSV